MQPRHRQTPPGHGYIRPMCNTDRISHSTWVFLDPENNQHSGGGLWVHSRRYRESGYQAVPAVTGGSIQPQVASIKEKRRKRKKKKKIMNSGRMGSLANNGQQPHVKEFLR